MDEDSCHEQPHKNDTSVLTNCERISDDEETDTITTPNVKSKNRSSNFGDPYIPLDFIEQRSKAASTIRTLSKYTSSLLSIKNVEPSVLRILTPNTINRKALLSATSIMANEPFFEDKRPGVPDAIPLYNSVYSSESAMAQGGRTINSPIHRLREISGRTQSRVPAIATGIPLPVHRNVTHPIVLGDIDASASANKTKKKNIDHDDSIVFVSEQLLCDQSVAAIRESRSQRKKRRVRFLFCIFYKIQYIEN